MTRFSPEPPRRNLLAHYTFDDVSGDKVIDHSPQSIDGKAVGDVTFDHTGVIGSAARMRNEESDIEITALSDQMPLSELYTSSWGRSEREVDATALNVYGAIEIGSTEYTLGHSTNEVTTTWQFASITYDGEVAELRYAHVNDDRPQVVDSVDATGDVTDFELSFYTNGYGFVDDVRIYNTALDADRDYDLFRIGAEHQQTTNIENAWSNNGLPFIRDEGNERLASSLAESDDYVLRQLDGVLDARHINEAAGGQLDRIGEVADIDRNEGEADAHYRARIIATLAASRSDGTFRDLLETVATILDTTIDRVELEQQWQTSPTAGIATAEIFVRTVDINNIELSASELTTIMKDAVPGGHDIEITEQGANPFTVRNDSQANDSSLGLTSDGVQSGGGLVADP